MLVRMQNDYTDNSYNYHIDDSHDTDDHNTDNNTTYTDDNYNEDVMIIIMILFESTINNDTILVPLIIMNMLC